MEDCKIHEELRTKRTEVNRKLKNLAEENKENTLFCDITSTLSYVSLSEEERKKIWDDKLHFTPLGYDMMGNKIYETIKNFI